MGRTLKYLNLTGPAALNLLLFLLMKSVLAQAQEAHTSASQVEAAFLYHFAEFVAWPAEALPAPNAPILFGVLGDDPVGADLESAIRNKEIGGHPLRLKHFDTRSLAEVRRCHILFIRTVDKKHLGEILGELQGSSVLTVSALSQFTQAGGMIQFYIEAKRVRFEINDQAARRAGLKISAKLLSLARKKEAP